MTTETNPLIQVAQLDQQRLQAQRELRKVREQIEQARKDINNVQKQMDQRHAEYDAIEKESVAASQSFKLQEAIIARLEEQVPRIRNQKEFIASKKQLEDTRKKRGEVEDELLQIDIRKEDTKKALEELKATLATATEAFEKETSELQSQESGIQKRIDVIQSEHKQSFANLDAPIQKFYDACQNRGIIPPIAEVVNQTCSGCHTLIPPQLLNEMIADPTERYQCPHCTRLLYYIIPEPEES